MPALIGGLIVLVQGFTVGLFGGYSPDLDVGPFLLHVLFLGVLPGIAFFEIARPLPDDFVSDVAAAAVATGLILALTRVFDGLKSSNATLLKFAVTSYALYAIIAQIVMRQWDKRQAEGQTPDASGQ